MSNAAESWRSLFENWPNSLPRKGMLVTTFDTGIPFAGYMIAGGLLLVDRDKPDAAGARKVIVPWEQILGMKITDVIDLARFQALGFQPPM
jgi:hypothetical protein